MKTRIFTTILVLSCFMGLGLGTRNDAAYRSKQASIDGYSLVGLHVLNVTLHASGYSEARSGSVSNVYFTDWAWWPNTISNHATWVSHIPFGQRANGSVLIGVGINSPWGAVNLFGGQRYLSIDF